MPRRIGEPRARYRIPDVLLCDLPIPRTKTLESIPIAVIEIWSPDDRIGQQMARFREYWDRGVRQIIVLDPENFSTLRYEAGALAEAVVTHLDMLAGGVIPFNCELILNELRGNLQQGYGLI